MAGTVTCVITSIVVQFSGGLIVSVNVNYDLVGSWGDVQPASRTWQLTPAEQASAAATGFTAALVAHLANVTGITVTTS